MKILRETYCIQLDKCYIDILSGFRCQNAYEVYKYRVLCPDL